MTTLELERYDYEDMMLNEMKVIMSSNDRLNTKISFTSDLRRESDIVDYLIQNYNDSVSKDPTEEINNSRAYEWSIKFSDLVANRLKGDQDNFYLATDIWNLFKPNFKSDLDELSRINIRDILYQKMIYFPCICDFINMYNIELKLDKKFDNIFIILSNCCATNEYIHFYDKKIIAISIIELSLELGWKKTYKTQKKMLKKYRSKKTGISELKITKGKYLVIDSYYMFNKDFGVVKGLKKYFSVDDIGNYKTFNKSYNKKDDMQYDNINCSKGHKLKKIGSGTYGNVIQKNINNIEYAVKKFKYFSDYIREILNYNFVEHENVINPLGYGRKCITYDLYETDLKKYVSSLNKNKKHLDKLLIKSYIYQILLGVQYLHHNFIAHLDLKPNNILLNMDGSLVLADLGSSSRFGIPILSSKKFYTTYMYAPPEELNRLVYGTKINRSPIAIDIWSVGCLFAYMLMSDHLFKFKNLLNGLNLINSYLDQVENLQSWSSFFSVKLDPLEDDMLMLMLTRDFENRANVDELLEHAYFSDFIDEYYS